MPASQPVFRAIADPTRREILSMLAGEELSVGEVAARFDMTRPAVAKHLGILREADLIVVRSEGRRHVNRLKPEALKTVADWLSYFDRFWDEKLAKLKSTLENDND
ncbi:MAG: ArsR family transcriptional regulator [Acidimicrobiales bacterium]|nr:MAG: ArsR family transcriptional regulator [Acidimicrobiales bacterium]